MKPVVVCEPPPEMVDFFQKKGWKPFDFQLRTWEAASQGHSGLVHAPTGTGKTLAVWLPAVLEALTEGSCSTDKRKGLRVLWITPLRALVEDTTRALREVLEDLGLEWRVEARTGDTSSSVKARQRRQFPEALITTPESLSLLLSYPETEAQFGSLRTVVIDEWHELLSTKRGVQTELGLARLRRWNPALRTWGLSATLGNLEEALQTLMGPGREGVLISGHLGKEIRVETLLPESMERFPWSGHLGLNLLQPVIRAIESAGTTLVFTNVRSQTEYWFRALKEARPDWEGELAIHHGSLDREVREEVEGRLREGTVRAVVCTSSLDLGVDFSPVDQVIQIGGPKGVARLIQRAGRSGHRPGAVSRVLCVPTQAIEIVEYAAAREAMARGSLENRPALKAPLDLLSQHLVTLALGGGFDAVEVLKEVRSTAAYATLSDEEWAWTLDFITRGGNCLQAYDQFRRVVLEEGKCRVESREVARFHRMSIGTISSDQAVQVRYLSGKSLGTVEEAFISKVRPGSTFSFAGLTLTLVRIRDGSAYVRKASRGKGVVPVWGGGRSPLSSTLALAVRRQFDEALQDRWGSPELLAVKEMLQIQRTRSVLPAQDELLIEQIQTREGWHAFVFPFGGRLAHEGLASLIAHRIVRDRPMTLTLSVNDYGLELASPETLEWNESGWRQLLSPDRLLEDLLECLHSTEVMRRQFREVSRVAGLVFDGYPGARKSARQVMASSSLFFEVFQKYDPQNLLLEQCRREVLDGQLEVTRLRRILEGMSRQTLQLMNPVRLTPFSFPLWAEGLRTRVSSESWSDRVASMAAELERTLEKCADAGMS